MFNKSVKIHIKAKKRNTSTYIFIKYCLENKGCKTGKSVKQAKGMPLALDSWPWLPDLTSGPPSLAFYWPGLATNSRTYFSATKKAEIFKISIK